MEASNSSQEPHPCTTHKQARIRTKRSQTLRRTTRSKTRVMYVLGALIESIDVSGGRSKPSGEGILIMREAELPLGDRFSRSEASSSSFGKKTLPAPHQTTQIQPEISAHKAKSQKYASNCTSVYLRSTQTQTIHEENHSTAIRINGSTQEKPHHCSRPSRRRRWYPHP
jgi:hypothetical protein